MSTHPTHTGGLIRVGEYVESSAPNAPEPRNGRRSQYLTEKALLSLERIGDLYCPGDHEMPSFSELGCIEHIDRIAREMNPTDVRDINTLLLVLGFLPRPLLKLFVYLIEKSPSFPTWGFGILRFIRLGIKGLVVSLYYSGFTGRDFRKPNPHDILGFKMRVYVQDLEK